MNKNLKSVLGCSGSIAAILATGTVANPDTAKTIPYPEVLNLETVPTFNYQGIIVSRFSPNKVKLGNVRTNRSKLPLTDRAKTVVELAVERFGCDCPGCQNRMRRMMTGKNLYSSIQVY